MSINQLLSPNTYDINASTISIKQTILDSQNTKYTLVLPNDNNAGPNSVLLIDTIIDDKVYLKFSAPINPPQAPFDLIECNNLIANVDVTSKSLTIDNISGNSSNFIYNGNEIIDYTLPSTLPSQDSILKSDNIGTLEWVSEPIIPNPYIPLRHWFLDFTIVNLTNANPTASRQSLISPIVYGMYYNVFFNFKIIKNNPTGNINLTYSCNFSNVTTYGLSYSNVSLPLTVGGSTVPDQTDYFKTNNFQIRAPTSGSLDSNINISFISDITGAGDITISELTVVVSPINYNQQ